jgi:hypothetical protein
LKFECIMCLDISQLNFALDNAQNLSVAIMHHVT